MTKSGEFRFLCRTFEQAAASGVDVRCMDGRIWRYRANDIEAHWKKLDEMTESERERDHATWHEKQRPRNTLLSYWGKVEAVILRAFCGRRGWAVNSRSLSFPSYDDGMYSPVSAYAVPASDKRRCSATFRTCVDLFLRASVGLPETEGLEDDLAKGLSATVVPVPVFAGFLAALAETTHDPVIRPVTITSIKVEDAFASISEDFAFEYPKSPLPQPSTPLWKDCVVADWKSLFEVYASQDFRLTVFPSNILLLMAYALDKIEREKIDLRAVMSSSSGSRFRGNVGPRLNATQRTAIELIRNSGGIDGKSLATQLGVEYETLRTKIIPALRPHGVVNYRNGDGYQIESE